MDLFCIFFREEIMTSPLFAYFPEHAPEAMFAELEYWRQLLCGA